LGCPRRLAAVGIGVPRGRGDLVELPAERTERGVLELSQKAPAELGLVQARTGHSLAGREPRHRNGINAAAPRRLRGVAPAAPSTASRRRKAGPRRTKFPLTSCLGATSPRASAPVCRPTAGGPDSSSPRIA